MLRRYFAGYTLFADFLIRETEQEKLADPTALRSMLRANAILFDRLIAAVSEEHATEARSQPDSSEQRHAERIERLLAGEPVDTSALRYDFEATHLGVAATGLGAAEALRELAASFRQPSLVVPRHGATAWAWLGSRKGLDPVEIESFVSSCRPDSFAIAAGEPAQGLAGWRLTHRQAVVALPVAARAPHRLVRYADVALLASVLQDDLLADSLRRLYLVPLENERDGGEVSRETLHAYFAAGRNVSSAAAALGVNRHTVTYRLRAIEERLGSTLGSRAADLETALRLKELDRTHQAME